MSNVQQALLLDQAVRRLNAGDFQQATKLSRQILAANKREPKALAILGHIANLSSDFEEAISCFRKCTNLAPKGVDYHALLAEAYNMSGRYREAVQRYDKALRLNPEYAPALAGKANALIGSKNWDAAKTLLDPYIQARTESSGMATVYARATRHLKNFDEAIEVLQRHVGSEMPQHLRRSLEFELARSFDLAGRHDEAFAQYILANQSSVGTWDPDASRARYRELMDVFTRDTLAGLPRASNASNTPIFIVSMPRSGSTLIEQILSSHPDVFGAGEVFYMHELVVDMNMNIGSMLPFPQCIEDLEQEDVETLGAAYLERLRAQSPKSPHITDKNLNNYEHLGIITLLFPDARIIHARRHPLDTCVSCFFQKFSPVAPAYSDDLRHLGMKYADYVNLMAHWDQVLDHDILTIDYEQMVADQEGQTRRLLEYCRLPWDEKCLRYYESKRKVLTLSRDQVDKPIYTSSIGRYEKYGDRLAPLRQALEEGGVTL